MNTYIENLKNTIKRIFSNDVRAMKIYIGWGLLTLVVFGIFGFIPVSKAFVSNVKLLDAMYRNNQSLEKKISDLRDAKEKLDIVGNDVDVLDKYLPNDFEPQTYMVELSSMSGDAGYSLDKVNFGKIENSRVSMSLGISGKGDLKKLINSMESSGRITEVEDIKLTIGDREDSLSIKISSYIMEKR